MSELLFFSLTAAVNPTLVAASTTMLLFPDAKRLMLGYLAGALLTSVTLGLLIVFVLDAQGPLFDSSQQTLSPALDLTLGALALIAAAVLNGGGREARAERRRQRRAEKGEPRWQQALGKGSPRIAFVVGVALTLPGASYLAALHQVDVLGYDPAVTVLLVIGVNAIMLALLELPLLGFLLAPDSTERRVDAVKAWFGRHGRRAATVALAALGCALILKGLLGLLAA
ncbi:MAG TPA: GAP family protein [Solirubrobacterales bacterium]|nr:GAP family protein [Solirubrobacterales bacterium]